MNLLGGYKIKIKMRMLNIEEVIKQLPDLRRLISKYFTINDETVYIKVPVYVDVYYKKYDVRVIPYLPPIRIPEPVAVRPKTIWGIEGCENTLFTIRLGQTPRKNNIYIFDWKCESAKNRSFNIWKTE